ncbi:MAG: hypothetical protein SNJ74_09775 [Fimbriimonadaceae bacterium]
MAGKKRGNGFWGGVLFVVLAIGAGAAMSAKTWDAYHRQRAETARATAEMVSAEKRREALVRERAYAESPAGREALARQQGFRRPGEQPLEPAR